jgi:flagellar export protein FliJ
MSRPVYPFEIILTRAEEERDNCQRKYLRMRSKLRDQERVVYSQRTELESNFSELAARRLQGGLGASQQNYVHYITSKSRNLRRMLDAESKLEREVEEARQTFLRAALKARVWASLRERFFQSWQARLRKIEETELEDWSRARLKPTAS